MVFKLELRLSFIKKTNLPQEKNGGNVYKVNNILRIGNAAERVSRILLKTKLDQTLSKHFGNSGEKKTHF